MIFYLIASGINFNGIPGLMKIGSLCIRDIVLAEKTCTIERAAKLMRQHHVGSVVVVSREEKGNKPIGIFTDRDLVVGIIAEEIDVKTVTLGDVMRDHLITAREDDDLNETIERMSSKGVRRIPVVDRNGCLVGIFSADDTLKILSYN